MFAVLTSTTEPSPAAALCIFGASSLIPIFVFEARHPLLRKRSLRIARRSLERLWAIGAPLAPGTIAFLIWNSADQIWVGDTFGRYDIGTYGAARNLSQVLMVPIVGFTGALLPRVAELRASRERARAVRLMSWTTWMLVATCAGIAAVLIVGRTFLLETFYGDAYGAGASALVGLSVGMVLFGGFSALGQGVMGWGAPRVYSIGYVVAAAVEVTLLVGGRLEPAVRGRVGVRRIDRLGLGGDGALSAPAPVRPCGRSLRAASGRAARSPQRELSSHCVRPSCDFE